MTWQRPLLALALLAGCVLGPGGASSASSSTVAADLSVSLAAPFPPVPAPALRAIFAAQEAAKGSQFAAFSKCATALGERNSVGRKEQDVTDDSCGDSALGRLAEALAVSAPLVEAQRHLGRAAATRCSLLKSAALASEEGEKAGAFFHVSTGDVVSFTSAADLEAVLTSAKKESAEVGCVFSGLVDELDISLPGSPAAVASGAPFLVLYADIGSPEFIEAHAAAVKAVELGLVQEYAVRQRFDVESTSGSGEMHLPGFGVELALKNLEYRTVDERVRAAASEDGTPASTDALPVEVDGFRFDVLKERVPGSKVALDAFRSHLLATEVELEDLKVWDVKDLDFLAAQRVLASDSTDLLGALAEVAQNIPMQAPSLVRVRVNQTIKELLKSNMNRAGVNGGDALCVINGRRVDPEKTDIFALFAIVAEESSKANDLRALRVPTSIASLLLARGGSAGEDGESTDSSHLRVLTPAGDELSGGGPAPSRFDVRVDGAFWMNNFDHDARYSQMNKHVNGIFLRVWPGQFRQVARDFFTIINVGDLSDPAFLQLAQISWSVINQRIPVRFGLWVITEDVGALYDKWIASDSNKEPVDAVAEVMDRTTMGYQVAKLFWFLAIELNNRDAAITFVTTVAESVSGGMMGGETIPVGFDAHVAPAFELAAYDLPSASSVVARQDLPEVDRRIAVQNLRALEVFGLETSFPLAFVNGERCTGDGPGQMIQSCVQVSMRQVWGVQRRVRAGRIHQNTPDIYDQLLDSAENDDVFSRFNQQLLPDPYTNPLRYVSLASASARSHMALAGATPNEVAPLTWLTHPRFRDATKAVSIILAGDLASAAGARQALETIRLMKSEPIDAELTGPGDMDIRNMRFALLHHGEDAKGYFISHAVSAAVSTQMSQRGFHLAAKMVERHAELVSESSAFDAVALDQLLEDPAFTKVNRDALLARLSALQNNQEIVSAQRHIATDVLSLKTGDVALVINGRFVSVYDNEAHEDSRFASPDLRFLMQYERRERADRIVQILTAGPGGPVEFDNLSEEAQTSDYVSDVVMATASILGVDASRGVEVVKVSPKMEDPAVASLDVGAGEGAVSILAVLDPLSKATQRLAPMLQTLVNFLPDMVRVRIIFTPRDLSELPLKSFYRYVVPAAPGKSPMAIFERLPPERLLTTTLDEPRSWLVLASDVQPSFADLDNIKLGDVNDHWRSVDPSRRGIAATFKLENILVEGHCYDLSNVHESGAPQPIPPTGLEIVLRPSGSSADGSNQRWPDTIVMSNLGYFQLKANPGLYDLALKPGTKSEQMYSFTRAKDPRVFLSDTVSEDGSDVEESAGSAFDLPTKSILISSFAPSRHELWVRKLPEFKGRSLLWEEGEKRDYDDEPVYNSLFGVAQPRRKPKRPVIEDPANETVHVFSLASGKLYERFLGIMMLSVVKNTQNPVKFWFLANFLSPEFKTNVPHMASKYGFDVELVTYKWPDWLNAQTEKQRIIWGHKILFLDVLFPLDVKKIVYVDADQVVRGDLHELWTMDLKGAPYAYTPFCLPPVDNKETTGFRFWAQGFWKQHLGNLPYHISALYYVDLERFRKLGAGDTLRQTYHSLSQDPGSLSNLDQDLPNYLQRQVKIHSLPQEWLWCETWCSNDIKPAAKTIDLCNNPLTKTPKLEAARTIIPEWSELDREASAAMRGEANEK